MNYLTFNTLIVSLFFVMSANASDTHVYNGSICKNYISGEANDFMYGISGIKNTSSNYKVISCPLIVDSVDNTNGTSHIRVHASGAGNTSCYIYSMNGNGTAREMRFKGRTGTGWLSIPNITNDDYWGSYAIYCYLPPKGELNTIWIDE